MVDATGIITISNHLGAYYLCNIVNQTNINKLIATDVNNNSQ